MNCLVTGGAGFIGSNLVRALLYNGNSVRILDNFTTGKRENISPILDTVDLIEGDLRSYQILYEATKDIEVIFHQGALPSVPRSINDPFSTNQVNIDGTLNTLAAAQANRVRRVIYASSASVYGQVSNLPICEEMPSDPISPYGVSKLAGEKYCRFYTRVHGVETVCLRYFNVFGPAQDGHGRHAGAIATFITSILEGRRISVHGDGEQTKDFTFVDNVIHGNLLAASVKGAEGQTFNLACGVQTSVNKILKHLARLAGCRFEVSYVQARLGDIKHSLANIGKAHRVLGYCPPVHVVEGLQRSLEWYRNNMKR